MIRRFSKDAAMISREPTIERLAVARSLLLEPFGLSDASLSRALAEIATHRIDDAVDTRQRGFFHVGGVRHRHFAAAHALDRRVEFVQRLLRKPRGDLGRDGAALPALVDDDDAPRALQ